MSEMDGQNGVVSNMMESFFFSLFFSFPLIQPLLFRTLYFLFFQILGGCVVTSPASVGQVVSWSCNNAVKLGDSPEEQLFLFCEMLPQA